MRIATLARLGVYLALLVVLQGAKCPTIPTTKNLKMTVVTQQYVELTFAARGSINTHSDTDTIDVAQLRQDLEDAGVDVESVDSVFVASVLYGVTAYNEAATDREIVDGTVTVSRPDEASSATIFDNVDQPVYPLLGELVPAPVELGGIAYVNDLLADVLQAIKSGGSEIFLVEADASGVSEPQGRYTNFDWRVRINFHVVGETDMEVPDF